MQTLMFSIHAAINPTSIANHVATEFQPIWSVVETRVNDSPGETLTAERVLVCGVGADQAYRLMVDLVTESVAGKNNFDEVIKSWRRMNKVRGFAIRQRKERNKECTSRAS